MNELSSREGSRWHERRVLLVLALGAGLATGACYQGTIVLKVNADGSGTIEETVLVTPETAAKIQDLAATDLSPATDPSLVLDPADPIPEDLLRSQALGANMTFVSSSSLKTDHGEGRTAIFAFTDVTRLKIGGWPSGQFNSNDQPRIDLARQPNGNVLLRMTLPSLGPDQVSGTGGTMSLSPEASAAGITEEQLERLEREAARKLLAGMHVVIDVEPSGRLVATSSPYTDGRRVSLLDLDLDELLKDDAGLVRLQHAQTAEEWNDVVRQIPGCKISYGETVTIEFTAER